MARRYLRGIRVDADTLAEDVIAGVGPGGNFLAEEHTLKFLHSDEFCHWQLFNRQARNQGGRSAGEAAHERVLELLSDQPSPVPTDQQAAFRAIIAGRLEESIL
jgi:trimethylamine--corrinoid protein Co-methyltransferase